MRCRRERRRRRNEEEEVSRRSGSLRSCGEGWCCFKCVRTVRCRASPGKGVAFKKALSQQAHPRSPNDWSIRISSLHRNRRAPSGRILPSGSSWFGAPRVAPIPAIFGALMVVIAREAHCKRLGRHRSCPFAFVQRWRVVK